MGTPTGPAADAARRYYARERRRLKQGQAAFGSSPFDFGAVAAGGLSANTLTIPASGRIALSSTVATAAGDLGVLDVTTGIEYVSAEAGQAGGFVIIRRLFPASHQIQISRKAGTPDGEVSVYFVGPNTKLILIGTASFGAGGGAPLNSLTTIVGDPITTISGDYITTI